MIADTQNPKRTKRVLFWMGMALATCSAILTAEAGYRLHGVVLGLAFVIFTYGACFMPNEFVQALRSGRYGSALFAGLVTILFVKGELAGELMVMTSVRNVSDQSATIQNARYDDMRNALASATGRLAVLQQKFDEQTKFGTSASYAPQIEAADALAARESSKDRKGCRAKCDAAKAHAADLRAKQAIAKDREENTEPTIKALTAEIATLRAEAKTTEKGYSASAGQTDLFAKVATGNLNPDGSSKHWTEIYFTVFMAFLFTFGSMGLTYMSQQDWTPKPKTARRNIFVRFAQFCRRMYCHATGQVITEPSSHTREVVINDARGLLMGAYKGA